MPIDPFKEDIGRKVVHEQFLGDKIRTGTITSFNPDYVYVQFNGDGFSTSVPREELLYEEEFLARYR